MSSTSSNSHEGHLRLVLLGQGLRRLGSWSADHRIVPLAAAAAIMGHICGWCCYRCSAYRTVKMVKTAEQCVATSPAAAAA